MADCGLDGVDSGCVPGHGLRLLAGAPIPILRPLFAAPARCIAARPRMDLMSDKHFDVCGIGNAIVDVFSHCEEAFLARMSLTKGAMMLVDPKRSGELYDAMGP